MIIAIATWNGRVSPVFDVSRSLTLFTIENGLATWKQEASLESDYPDVRASRLSQMAVDILICGAVSRQLAGMIGACGIQVIPFVAGDIGEVMAAYLSGKLSGDAAGANLIMPGCCGRRRRFGHRDRKTVYRQCSSTQERGNKIMPKGNGTGPKGKGARKQGSGGCGGGQGRGGQGKNQSRQKTGQGGGCGNQKGSGGGRGKADQDQ